MRRLRPARRAFQALLALVFCCLAHVGEAAQLVLVSANQGAAVNAFRDALAQRRPQDQVELRTPAALAEGMVFADDTRLLLLGPEALAWRLRQHRAPPTLALLLNRVDGQRLLPGANGHGGHGVGGLCVLWSDPPASRQLRLARLILPGIQRIGVLYGKDSEFLLDELRREARSQGLQLFVASSSGNDDPRPLQFLLGNSDLLLGIDDKQLYNSQSIKSLLLGSYARPRAARPHRSLRQGRQPGEQLQRPGGLAGHPRRIARPGAPALAPQPLSRAFQGARQSAGSPFPGYRPGQRRRPRPAPRRRRRTMSQRHGWDIRTRMLAISLGPALLLTLLLTAYFTYSRLQDLRQELTHTGQLIADQLAPAAEYGVIAGNTPVLQKLLQATLDTPHVRFIEVRDRNDNILVYVEQLPGALQNAAPIDIFHSTIQRQRIALASDPLLDGASEGDGQSGEDYLGRVVVGMSNDAFSQRQQEILLKAALLAAFALILTFLVARRLAQRLSAPISTMGQAVEAIQSGDYKTSLPILDDGEIGDLARHINNLASGLDRASREQEQAISQLISAREEAEQANRAKSDFLAMMSHELRTPMNGVLGMLQLLETTEQTREQAEYTALATESTEHLLKVINDILDFSRIERGALELECIPFNLLELVQGSALVFQHSAQQRGLALELQIQAGLENIEVCGDPTRIRQILVNLLGNALKFTEEGAIHLSLEWQALDHDVLWLTCAVHDSGIGISPERLEHMFDAFQQADSSISRRYGGTGLGLAIARTLAERMGGTLQAESKEGSGSTFTLEIPLPFQQSPAHRQQAAGDAAPVAAGQEILLVEDNPVNQTVIEAMLRSLGYRVTLVADGIQAVRSAERQRYDAILMDCRLPVLDGYSATREIRAQENGRQVPIIALTANALQGDRENCLQAGMNDYLAKPFKRAELQRILQRWIGSQPELPVTSNETGRGEPE